MNLPDHRTSPRPRWPHGASGPRLGKRHGAIQAYRKDLLSGKTTIITGRTGSGARCFWPAWARSARRSAKAARRRRRFRRRTGAFAPPTSATGGGRALDALERVGPRPARRTTRPATSWPRRRTSPQRVPGSVVQTLYGSFHCTGSGRRLIERQQTGEILDRHQLRPDGSAFVLPSASWRRLAMMRCSPWSGPPTASVQCGRAGPFPAEGVQPPHAGLGDGEAGAAPQPSAASASTALTNLSLPHERREP
jgi:hypothetical protein